MTSSTIKYKHYISTQQIEIRTDCSQYVDPHSHLYGHKLPVPPISAIDRFFCCSATTINCYFLAVRDTYVVSL